MHGNTITLANTLATSTYNATLPKPQTQTSTATPTRNTNTFINPTTSNPFWQSQHMLATTTTFSHPVHSRPEGTEKNSDNNTNGHDDDDNKIQ
ncbi:hypothetical protein E2C01_009509 [Portunus trituberculatus]|uniref:Uncharacterized protein n=1 Tax=Portunus trituberculatus TaxID=210409 RepID=A0A5B7D5Z7_PORTR|nr:hypothetical protein [Portunus trituberculatus]